MAVNISFECGITLGYVFRLMNECSQYLSFPLNGGREKKDRYLFSFASSQMVSCRQDLTPFL
jgi:hypothetical protein